MTGHPWIRYVRLSCSYETTEPLERMASQRRFTRRALIPCACGCIGLSVKCGWVSMFQINGVRPFFFLFQKERRQSEGNPRTYHNRSGFMPGRGCSTSCTACVGASSKPPLYVSLTLLLPSIRGQRLSMEDIGCAWVVPKLLSSIKAYYVSTKIKVRTNGDDNNNIL